MIVNEKEISYISKIIKIQQYPYIDGLCFLTKKDYPSIEESLTNKEVLKDKQLTPLGLQLLHMLEYTSNCDVYIKWNQLWIYGASGGYIVIRVSNTNELHMHMMEQEELIRLLLTTIQENKELEEKPRRVELVSQQEFLEFCMQKPMISIYTYLQMNGTDTTIGTMYIDEGYLHHYLPDKQRLDKLPKEKAYATIEKILVGGTNHG